MSTIAELQKQIHENAKNKGFWDKEPNTGEKLCLIHSEISEAMEADRKGEYANRKGFERDMEGWEDEHVHLPRFKMEFEMLIKNKLEDELADAVIRIMDLCEYKGIDLEWHIQQKMKYNATRPYMHGKKY